MSLKGRFVAERTPVETGRRRGLADSEVLLDGPVPARHEAAERNCLRCGTRFHSEWAGERICSRCTSTQAWRQGLPMSPQPTR